MCVHNLPGPVSASLYEEAIAIYLANAGAYIESCYLIGNMNYPGLSDIDLIVIPRDKLFASRNLAIKRALPEQYHCIVLHNPYIVPRSHLYVFQYSLFGMKKLIFGPPLLADIEENLSPTATLCHSLEKLYYHYHYMHYCKQRSSLHGRLWIAVGSSLRFTMQWLAECSLISPCEVEDYKATYDQMRVRFLQKPCEECFYQMFRFYEAKLEHVLDEVAEGLDIDIRQVNSLSEFYSRESYSLPWVRHEEVLQREAAIQDYLRALRSRYFGYGSIFESSWRKPLPPMLGMRLWQWVKPTMCQLRKARQFLTP